HIAMEYLEGKTLKALLVSRGPTPVRVAIDYTRQILSALEFAHRHGIVHRDIKPHNVVVAPDGRLKVTDFGIARSGSSQMTEAGSIIGTAQYLSPEQAQGLPVAHQTEEAATAVLSGAGLEAATQVVPSAARGSGATTARMPPRYGRYYDYEEAAPRRPIWPWLLAALLLAAAGYAGYFV